MACLWLLHACIQIRVKCTYKKQQEGEGNHKETNNENGDKRPSDFHLLRVIFQLEHTATNTTVHNYTNQKQDEKNPSRYEHHLSGQVEKEREREREREREIGHSLVYIASKDISSLTPHDQQTKPSSRTPRKSSCSMFTMASTSSCNETHKLPVLSNNNMNSWC